MPTEEPSVCVVIPAFNRPDQLERAIRSVLAQTYQGPICLTVVDDASTLDLKICRELVLKSGHNWLSMDENSGPAAARNDGVAETPGDWISFLDSDDVWHPEKLAMQMRWHAANPNYRISQVEESWIRNGEPFAKPKHLRQPASGDLFGISAERCAIGPSCVAIRRDLWDECAGFDPSFRVCEDYELWLRITSREPVGLADEGTPLVEKHGGHKDQLSTATPALDRFRLLALAGLLDKKPELDPVQKDQVIEAIRRKSNILKKGAAKRNSTDWDDLLAEMEEIVGNR